MSHNLRNFPHKWDVRGPLHVLNESWEVTEKSGESVVSHILSIREKMDGAGAWEFGKAQETQSIGRWADNIEVDVQEEIQVWREHGPGTFSAEDIRFGEQLTAE